jgi:hypothetical protein
VADHAVFEPARGEFVRVRDASGAVRLPSKPQIGAPKPRVVYDVISSRHRIVTPSAEFADYLEVDEDFKHK